MREEKPEKREGKIRPALEAVRTLGDGFADAAAAKPAGRYGAGLVFRRVAGKDTRDIQPEQWSHGRSLMAVFSKSALLVADYFGIPPPDCSLFL